MTVIMETNLPNLFHRGKVRDTYDLGDTLLMVTTDRISTFDVVLPCGIPDKGLVLTQLSTFWFEKTAHLVPNHLVELVEDVRLLNSYWRGNACFVFPSYLAGRSLIVKKAKRIPVEAVVRGYLSGSAWAEYQERGTVNGMPLSSGRRESDRLPQPLFTPATKAETGHDENLTPQELEKLVGKDLARQLEEKSLAIYNFAEKHCRERGLILADTKMEFGFIEGKLALIDELLTPDSSRFWDTAQYTPGKSQPSFDKQLARDSAVASGWNKEPPGPMLPPEIIEQTSQRYRQAFQRLTGRSLLHY